MKEGALRDGFFSMKLKWDDEKLYQERDTGVKKQILYTDKYEA